MKKYPDNWQEISESVKREAKWRCIRCRRKHCWQDGYVLTVHHFDGDTTNNRWWNLMALCQRCHLSVQNRVNPEIPYFLDHSEWIRPYVAGFYAKKYLGERLSREDVEKRMDELLGLEQIISG